ncbi:MAG TPA: endonuclease domain-containing protein [Thermoanaerobaculia bacterium]|nr:endonuclease domain-containing protein [Thermoanaerobaculia bacterium]
MRVTPVRRQRSRHLRQELTPSELRVWSWLRDRRFGDYKFRRQFAIGPFILDFYCAALKVALELDGRQHEADWYADYEFRRTTFLNERGIHVLRVSNDIVMNDVDGVERWLRYELSLRANS